MFYFWKGILKFLSVSFCCWMVKNTSGFLKWHEFLVMNKLVLFIIYILKYLIQGFSTVPLWTFWVAWFFIVGACSGCCRLFSNTAVPYPSADSSPHHTQLEKPQMLANGWDTWGRVRVLIRQKNMTVALILVNSCMKKSTLCIKNLKESLLKSAYHPLNTISLILLDIK